RAAGLERYAREISELGALLSQSDTQVPVTSEVRDCITRYGQWFPDALDSVPPRHREMPYRVLCRLMQARLSATAADGAQGYRNAGEFSADLTAIAESLRGNRGVHAGLFPVERAIRRVEAFGFHLATLDVR